MTDIMVQASELTRQVAQTKEYARLLLVLQTASMRVRLMRDERGLPHDEKYQSLAAIEQWLPGVRELCDQWLNEHEYRLHELMVRITDSD